MKKIIVLFLAIFALGIVDARKINSDGIAFMKLAEGFEPNYYDDTAGKKTIGYGHNCEVRDCTGLKRPMTRDEAADLLVADLVEFELCVNNFAPYLNDDQFTALVSFTFNAGCHSLTNTKKSTIGRLIKARDYPAAADQFALWNKATKNGKLVVDRGLVNRRRDEKRRFCRSGGCEPPIRFTY